MLHEDEMIEQALKLIREARQFPNVALDRLRQLEDLLVEYRDQDE